MTQLKNSSASIKQVNTIQDFSTMCFFLIWFHQWRMFLFLPPFLNSFDSPGPCPRPTHYSSREITSPTESLSWCLLCIINLRIFFVGIFIYNHGQLVMVVCFFFSFLAALHSSPTREWIQVPAVTAPSLNHWPTKVFHTPSFLSFHSIRCVPSNVTTLSIKLWNCFSESVIYMF